MDIPKRPEFRSPSQASDTAAVTSRLDHLMTLMETLIVVFARPLVNVTGSDPGPMNYTATMTVDGRDVPVRAAPKPTPQMIRLSAHEIQSGSDRITYAEALILQLPPHHDGRNTWLLNYGKGEHAKAMRTGRGLLWDGLTESAEGVGVLSR